MHRHVGRPCTEWGYRGDSLERAWRHPVALLENGDDGRSNEKMVDEIFSPEKVVAALDVFAVKLLRRARVPGVGDSTERRAPL